MRSGKVEHGMEHLLMASCPLRPSPHRATKGHDTKTTCPLAGHHLLSAIPHRYRAVSSGLLHATPSASAGGGGTEPAAASVIEVAQTLLYGIWSENVA